jgi:hypothetical protein
MAAQQGWADLSEVAVDVAREGGRRRLDQLPPVLGLGGAERANVDAVDLADVSRKMLTTVSERFLSGAAPPRSN